MGRVSYEDMATVWPNSDSDYAAPMNEIPKVVFSKALEQASWPPARIASGELNAEIAALKTEEGDYLLAHGGAQFARALARPGRGAAISTGAVGHVYVPRQAEAAQRR